MIRTDSVPSEGCEPNVGLHKSLYCCDYVVDPSFIHYARNMVTFQSLQ